MVQRISIWRRTAGAALLATGLMAASQHAVAQARYANLQAAQEPSADADFQSFVASLWPEARARGVSVATFNAAFADLTPDPKIVALSQKQSEFARPIWDYLAGAAAPTRIVKGQEVAAELAQLLDAVEHAYGVPKGVVLGIWGMETNFGRFTGTIPVVRALATLAFIRHRGDFFRNELLVALQMLEGRHVAGAAMLGSWAGAMGQTQFMPSSYVRYAVDGDGDGRADIWRSMPDALASTANYLRRHGWRPGLPWGFEVKLPKGFDFRNHRHGFASWQRLGVRPIDRRAMPWSGEATLLLPAGRRGPAFLVTENYAVIKAYNSSDAYALGVAHLGDRIYGGRPVAGDWPKDERLLDKDQREEVQRRLGRLGFYAGDADGRFGSQTRDAVRRFQLRRGLAADGYADWAVLRELRAVR
jgi:membrane-bound lytic murein transglycosylase B